MKTYTYIIPQYYAVAIANGDDSGLDIDEIEILDNFIADLVKDHGHAHMSFGENLFWQESNDMTDYAGECLEGTILV